MLVTMKPHPTFQPVPVKQQASAHCYSLNAKEPARQTAAIITETVARVSLQSMPIDRASAICTFRQASQQRRNGVLNSSPNPDAKTAYTRSSSHPRKRSPSLRQAWKVLLRRARHTRCGTRRCKCLCYALPSRFFLRRRFSWERVSPPSSSSAPEDGGCGGGAAAGAAGRAGGARDATGRTVAVGGCASCRSDTGRCCA